MHGNSVAVPDDLQTAITQHSTEGTRRHADVLKSGDWDAVVPFFSQGLNLAREMASAKQAYFGYENAYDALLADYAPGTTSQDLDREFSKLEPFIKALLPKVLDKQSKSSNPLPLPTDFVPEVQEKICHKICEALGFDFNRGRMDFIDDHPSSGGTIDDSCITARHDKSNILLPIYDIIHEVGHGCYEQGCPKEWRYQPAGYVMGMDIHESQSLMYECQIGKSPEFCEYLSRTIGKVSGKKQSRALSAQNLHNQLTRVVKTPVRISMETSEVTYPMHIIMRYRLEKDLLEGRLDPVDLPEAWNDLSADLLGVRPQNHQEGVLQDVHWFCGCWGYFPTYVMGAMGASQFYEAAIQKHPEIPSEMEKGNFQPLYDWLRENVHGKGSLLTTKELYAQATGEILNARYYMNHLSRRYLDQSLPEPTSKPARGLKNDI